MLVVDLTQEEVDHRVEHFFTEIDKTINTHNHPYKYKDDQEILDMLNYLFKLSGSKLRIHDVNPDGEPAYVLKPLTSTVHSKYGLYSFYHQFNRDILALKEVLDAFKHLYRFKHRYQHLWE